MARRRLDPEARRAAILDAAVTAFDEVGPEQVNLEMVAERAGVSRALVYTYFTNRVGLVRAVFEQVLADLGAAVERDLRGAVGPEDRLGRWITTLAGYARAHPNRWQVIRWNVLAPDPDGADGLHELLAHLGPVDGRPATGQRLALTALVGMVDWTAAQLDEHGTTELATLAWAGTSALPAVRRLWQDPVVDPVDNTRDPQGYAPGAPQGDRRTVVPGTRPEG